MTIPEAEAAYREAELELKERRDRRDRQLGLPMVAFGAGGFIILIIGLILAHFAKSESNSFLILVALGTAFLLVSLAFLLVSLQGAGFQIYQDRMRPLEVEAALDELEDAQKRWLQSAGFEATTKTIDELGFDLDPDRFRDTTFGSTQLFHEPTGKVIPVVLRHEIGKGYVLYGPEGVLLEEYPAKGSV